MRKLLHCAMLVSLAGCGTMGRLGHVGRAPKMSEVEQVAVPDVEASLARDRAAAPPPAGIASPSASLFRTGSGALFQDQRAAKAGDILTIRIDISDKASVSNSTSRTRDGSESGGASAIFGLEKIVKDIVGVDTANLVGSQTSSSSSGKGSTSRSETISMTMAAIVTAERRRARRMLDLAVS